jgi:hypothetical protein
LLVAISAPYGDSNTSTAAKVISAGIIYTYLKNSSGAWNVDQALTAEGSNAYDYMGFAMDLNSDGTQIVAGAHGHDGAVSGAGAVHMFAKDAKGKFALQKTIFHADGTCAMVWFKCAVAGVVTCALCA